MHELSLSYLQHRSTVRNEKNPNFSYLPPPAISFYHFTHPVRQVGRRLLVHRDEKAVLPLKLGAVVAVKTSCLLFSSHEGGTGGT